MCLHIWVVNKDQWKTHRKWHLHKITQIQKVTFWHLKVCKEVPDYIHTQTYLQTYKYKKEHETNFAYDIYVIICTYSQKIISTCFAGFPSAAHAEKVNNKRC